MYLANLYVSLLDLIADGIEASLDVLGSLVKSGFLCKAIAPILSQKIFIGPDALGMSPRSDMNSFIQTPSLVASEAAMCLRSGNGGPQTCLPAACGVAQAGPSTAHLHQLMLKDPREGPSLTGRTTGSFLRGSLIRQACEEAERPRQGYLARNP